jgi:hypothetical protein
MIAGPEEGRLENLIGHLGALKRWPFYSRRLGQASTFPHCVFFWSLGFYAIMLLCGLTL